MYHSMILYSKIALIHGLVLLTVQGDTRQLSRQRSKFYGESHRQSYIWNSKESDIDGKIFSSEVLKEEFKVLYHLKQR